MNNPSKKFGTSSEENAHTVVKFVLVFHFVLLITSGLIGTQLMAFNDIATIRSLHLDPNGSLGSCN
jgi:hypothetical protein